MYHVHVLTLVRQSKEEERYGCLLRSSYVCDDALLAYEPPSCRHMLAAFKADEPVLKLRRYGEAGWTEHRYAEDDWVVTDVATFDGLLYGVTGEGEHVAVVQLWPEVEVALLETESYDDDGGPGWEAAESVTRHHLFDVQTENTVDVAVLRTRGGRMESLGIF